MDGWLRRFQDWPRRQRYYCTTEVFPKHICPHRGPTIELRHLLRSLHELLKHQAPTVWAHNVNTLYTVMSNIVYLLQYPIRINPKTLIDSFPWMTAPKPTKVKQEQAGNLLEIQILTNPPRSQDHQPNPWQTCTKTIQNPCVSNRTHRIWWQSHDFSSTDSTVPAVSSALPPGSVAHFDGRRVGIHQGKTEPQNWTEPVRRTNRSISEANELTRIWGRSYSAMTQGYPWSTFPGWVRKTQHGHTRGLQIVTGPANNYVHSSVEEESP